MKKLLAITLIFAVSQAAWADRVIRQLEDAYELRYEESILPSVVPGTIVFKSCSECATSSLTVGSRARYLIGDRPVMYAEFKAYGDELFSAIGDDSFLTLFVFYDIDSQSVNRLVLRD